MASAEGGQDPDKDVDSIPVRRLPTAGGLLHRISTVAGLVPPLVAREVRSRYRTSALDIAWAVINPAVTLLAYGIILTQAFGAQSACGPYVTSAWSGLVLWMFFATSVTTGVTSVVSSPSLITKVYFPREALPLASTASAMLDLGIGLVTVVALMLLGGDEFTLSSLAALLPILMLICWTAAFAVFLSAVAVFVRDAVHLVQLLVRVGIFVTPVFYGVDVLPSGLAWLGTVNPVAVAIESFRSFALCGTAPNMSLLLAQTAAAMCALVGSVLFVRRAEPRIADLV